VAAVTVAVKARAEQVVAAKGQDDPAGPSHNRLKQPKTGRGEVENEQVEEPFGSGD
jgi:hypothetical protein